MTVVDAVQVMGVLDSLNDDTPEMAAITLELHRTLLKRPEDFWNTFWLVVNNDDHSFRAIEGLFESGALSDRTTFAEFSTGAAN